MDTVVVLQTSTEFCAVIIKTFTVAYLLRSHSEPVDGIQYVSTYDNSDSFQGWVDIYRSIRSTYKTTRLSADYSLLRNRDTEETVIVGGHIGFIHTGEVSDGGIFGIGSSAKSQITDNEIKIINRLYGFKQSVSGHSGTDHCQAGRQNNQNVHFESRGHVLGLAYHGDRYVAYQNHTLKIMFLM